MLRFINYCRPFYRNGTIPNPFLFPTKGYCTYDDFFDAPNPLPMTPQKPIKEPKEKPKLEDTKKEPSPIKGEYLDIQEKFIRGWGKGGQSTKYFAIQ